MNNPLPPGSHLKDGTYRIQSLHKISGQSIVYEGTDVKSGLQVIIKQNCEEQEFYHEATRQEACLLKSLRHRSLPQILDFFSERGGTFLVMNRISGSDIGEIMKKRKKPFSYIKVLDWSNQLLDILKYLQAQKPAIIHRDINPKNVRLTPENQIFLLDFGIAKRMDSKTFLVGGTPRYAPPEQLKDEGTDFRSDIYAFTATLYYLLTSVEPPDSLSREAALLKNLPDPLRPACDLNPEVPTLLSQVLSRALSLQRERRPNNAVEMMRRLSDAVNNLYVEEKATPAISTNEADPDETHTAVRNPVRVDIPLEVNIHGDVTQDTSRIINLLGGGYKFDPRLVQILIEIMDSHLAQRGEILSRHADILNKTHASKLQLIITLIYKLASGAPIEQEVKKTTAAEDGEVFSGSYLVRNVDRLYKARRNHSR